MAAPHRPHLIAALSNSPILIEKGSLSLTFLYAYNPSGAAAYVQLFDAPGTANVTVGTTVPLMAFGTNTLNVINPPLPEEGLRFGQGVVAAAATTATGSTTPSVALVLNVSLFG